MDNNFNFNSQICTTREQSERLLALGLKKETADCYHWQETESMYGEAAGIWHLETLDSHDNQDHFEYLDKYFGVCLADDEEHYFIPAWSLHRLMSLLPDYIVVNSSSGLNPNFYLNIRDGFVSYKDNRGFSYGSTSGNMYDAITRMISFLIKEGYFNKEYLV